MFFNPLSTSIMNACNQERFSKKKKREDINIIITIPFISWSFGYS